MLLLLLALGGATGCAWSNSLYLARRYSNEARSTELKGRPFEAQVLWGQVLSKAESAWARSGGKGNEARAYRGIAHARLGDCPDGVPDLQGALFPPSQGNWQAQVHYELGRCEQQLHLPGAEDQLRGLLLARDPNLRLQTGLVLSEIYLDGERWPEMLALLPESNVATLRFGRAVAEVGIGNLEQGRQLVVPLVATRDTSLAWQRLIEVLSRTRSLWTDSLLVTIGTFPNVSVPRRAEWFLAGIHGALAVADTSAANARLARLGQLGATVSLYEARRLVTEYQVARVTNLDELASVFAKLPVPGPEDGGPNTRMLEIRRTVLQMLSEKDSLIGVPQGDLRLMAQAEDATLILDAPVFARASLQRVEQAWPNSPYLVKSLLARMIAETDSADALRSRLGAHPESAYEAYLHLVNDDRFAHLEDSLGTFLKQRSVAAFNRGTIVYEVPHQ